MKMNNLALKNKGNSESILFQGLTLVVVNSWNTYILLDSLVCSIVGHFYELFWRARRASQNTRDEYNYPSILHTKPSNKRFIIQLEMF